MEFEDGAKTDGEILRSLLTSSKVENTQEIEVSSFNQLEDNYKIEDQCQEQIVWHIGSHQPDYKQFVTNDQSLVQHIPFTYLTTGDRCVAISNPTAFVKPVTYILRRDILTEEPNYGTLNRNEGDLILNKPKEIVLAQKLSGKVKSEPLTMGEDVGAAVFNVQENKPETLVGQMQRQYEEVKTNENEILVVSSNSDDGVVHEEIDCDQTLVREKIDAVLEKTQKIKRKFLKPDDIKVSARTAEVCDLEDSSQIKSKVEKKFSDSKKVLKKKKNSKLKSKLKTSSKPLIKKSKMNVKTSENEKTDKQIKEEKPGNNLFELTKLEDNADQVAERFKIGCECSDLNCFEGLNPDKVFKHRLNIADLTKAEHDMYLMGVIMASIHNLDETCRHTERIRVRSCYAYQGKKVCLTAFLYLQHVTLYQMKRLRSHLKIHGVSPRIHGNLGRKPANTFSLDIYRRATNFFQSYIEKNCVKSVPNFTAFSSNKIGSNPLSGSKLHESESGKKLNKVKILNKLTSYHLPPECTKKRVHKEYKSFCESLKPSQKVMKYSTFTNFLKKQFPNVKFQKVDKKQDDKQSSSEVRNSWTSMASDDQKFRERSNSEQGLIKNKYVQTPTVVYIPTESVHLHQPTTLVMAPKESPHAYYNAELVNSRSFVKNPQVILDGEHLHFYSGDGGSKMQADFRVPNLVMVNNQMYSTECMNQMPANVHQIYAVDSIV